MVGEQDVEVVHVVRDRHRRIRDLGLADHHADDAPVGAHAQGLTHRGPV